LTGSGWLAPLRRPAVWVPLALLPVMLVALEPMGIDLMLQDWLWSGHWLASRDDPALRLLLYRMPRWSFTLAGIFLFAAAIAGTRVPLLRPWRRRLFYVALCIALVPALAGSLKSVTDVHCPSQLVRYDGDQPYDGFVLKLAGAIPTTTRGRCFPAGHASGGFALLSLGWIARRRTWRLAGWGCGLLAGGVTGGYQMVVGAHFLSHTLATMLLAMAVTAWLAAIIRPARTIPDQAAF
jgi:membrane-associated PAP2 superfamily phosphatase